MNTCKTAIFSSPEEPIEIGMVPIPALEPEEILVKIEFVTLCRSDLNTYCGKRKEKTPTILGHEAVGRIAAFGPGAKRIDFGKQPIREGDRITWAIYSSDPDDKMALRGIPQKASVLLKYGHEQIKENHHLHGGLSEFIILRKNTPVALISENVPVEIAATVNCSVSTIAGAFRLIGNVSGKKILIAGAGMLGMVACAMCKIQGASSIFVVDINEYRLNNALQFGADLVALGFENLKEAIHQIYDCPDPFDAVIELSGNPDATEQSIDLLQIGGTAVLIGATYPARDLKLNAEKVIRNLLTIKGLHNYNEEDFLMAVTFLENHHDLFPFTKLISHSFPLSEVNEAFEFGIRENPFRVGIKIN